LCELVTWLAFFLDQIDVVLFQIVGESFGAPYLASGVLDEVPGLLEADAFGLEDGDGCSRYRLM